MAFDLLSCAGNGAAKTKNDKAQNKMNLNLIMKLV